MNESRTFRILHEISLSLSRAVTMDDLYRGIVEKGLNELGFDRIGLLLFDSKTRRMQGTWGTDTSGQLSDEKAFNLPLSSEAHWVWGVLKAKDHVTVSEDCDLYFWDKVVGRGWVAMVALWDQDEPIGWISVDNLRQQGPCTQELRNAIAYYGNTASHLIIRKRHELDLQGRVDQKTAQLLESEKLASMGRLVAGLAHEVNTPLGNAILGLSHSSEVLSALEEDFSSGTLSKTSLTTALAGLRAALDSSSLSLGRAAALVQSFRQLALEQHDEEPVAKLLLADLVDSALVGFKVALAARQILVERSFDLTWTVTTRPAMLVHILGHFVNNTLLHAGPTARITVSAGGLVSGGWYLEYEDFGAGVPDDLRNRLFEPFFTQTPGRAGPGLGLSIVHTLVTHKMGGQVRSYRPAEGGLGFRLEFS